MKILIDADASPVKSIVVRQAKAFNIPVVMVCNVNHMIQDDYATVITVDADHDAADHRIIFHTKARDLVITQDYGLAALALAKKADVMHHDGWFYDEQNIDGLLMKRHLHQKIRQSSKRHQGPAKRKTEQDKFFEVALLNYLENKTINK